MIASYLASDRESDSPLASRDNFINRTARLSQKVIFHSIFARKNVTRKIRLV